MSHLQMSLLSMDNETLWRFEKAHEDAKTAGVQNFHFGGETFNTLFAGWLIEHYKSMRKKTMAGSKDVEGFEDIMAEHKFTRLEAVIWKFQKEYYGYSDDVFPVKDLAQYIQTHVQDVQA